ncbi:acetyltransferase [Burkholderia ubonensis]|uniref:GNAT family N-acetyltransferase n=1 Tax=Burkholderia ubonensis TaxID=101571 RepID=UPI00075DA4F2|nr:GNAT family N-acetyltransferase [Burkholderia ubonensis]KVD09765.1 acetyltransferase [Burkholderia ubonensis]KVD23197.1 acetyltransferase [Burkholderia ubonensis]KVO71248.1 acetyltransferase [Burkholderia ubonensis]KVO90308.1 acetyltransferase [Burkholderia ubonensis]KVP37049.1 acetyltransferase [Burkholderia ubonensis]
MATTDRILDTTPLDVRAQPLIDALIEEYSTRYDAYRPDSRASAREELARYPAERFAPPEGAFILLLRDGETIGGGAFKRYDAQTAELKRIWTRTDLRRQGLARRIVEALEARAAQQGYRRIYLTTGFRQPEAWALYDRTGYARLFDSSIDPEAYFHLPFGKDLIDPSRTSTLADLWAPEPVLPR